MSIYLNVIDKIALSLLNTPYDWGGASPMSGLDCSGFALILLKSVGIVEYGDDMTADYMDDFLISKGGKVINNPEQGAFIFYGKTHRAKHVMYCLNDLQCIGAQGGGSHTKANDGTAIRHEAYIKVLPWNYRKDIIHIVSINDILIKI